MGWFLLLVWAWTRGRIQPEDVLIFGAVPASLYWTAGGFLERLGK